FSIFIFLISTPKNSIFEVYKFRKSHLLNLILIIGFYLLVSGFTPTLVSSSDRFLHIKLLIFFCIILSLLTFGITLLFALYYIIILYTTEQAITNKRVVFKNGLIARKTEEMNLNRVETVEVEQSILGRIFGYGNVKLTGTGSSFVIFKFVEDPLEVRKSITEALSE
ncbi:PH domain-containing protein, partial [Aliarcobacter cibarius]